MRRRLTVCGTNGSVELCPLERFDGQPITMSLVLKQAVPGYSVGRHTLTFGPVRDRYEDQLIEFAHMVTGRKQAPDSSGHDYLVQEVLMAASGIANWTPTDAKD